MGKVKDYYMEEIEADDASPDPYGPQLTLIRGLPGAGKSTYAQTHFSKSLHFEADQFFELNNGEYKFDPALISCAHDWCYSNTVKALRWGYDVVVTNTFTKLWELDRYLAIPGLLPNVVIEVVEMKTQYTNVHGVPDDKLKQMAGRWEDISSALQEQGVSFMQVLA